ncbi:MAG: DUF1549 domain-containing protein, partial [Planctomycetia bacterium]
MPLPHCLAPLAIVLCTAAEPTPQQLQFFENRVRPILVENCQQCHGTKKQWAGLRVDGRAALLTGGDAGPAIVPGKPDESLLIHAVKQLDDAPAMPPKGRLTERQVADLAEWIRQGAPFPDDVAAKNNIRDPNHWSFQPIRPSAPPPSTDSDWIVNAVDSYILPRLESAGLTPAPPADARTLLRRVTFNLTGLPPTPAEIDDYLADRRPDAYERLVDRLLSSPAYGERWARHWLDVARYADSNGLDENVAHGNAWKYRDYVVD